MLPGGDGSAPNQRALTSLVSNMRTSYGSLGGTNDLSREDTPVWNFLRNGRTEPAESKKWTAGRKALALFPVRSAGPSSRPRSRASVEDGCPRCHIHRRGRGQIPLGRPLSRPYPADHSENPSQSRAVIGFAARVTTGSRLLVTGRPAWRTGNRSAEKSPSVAFASSSPRSVLPVARARDHCAPTPARQRKTTAVR